MPEYQPGWEGMSLQPWNPEDGEPGFDEKPRVRIPGRYEMDEKPGPIYRRVDTEYGSAPQYSENVLLHPNPNALTWLPFSYNKAPAEQGGGYVDFAVPNIIPSMVNSAYNMLVGPGEILTGKTPLGAPAAPNPLGISLDIAGNLVGIGAGSRLAYGAADPLTMRSFGGLGARNVDLVGRKAAIALEASGVSKEEIFKQTGWFRDKDNQWKFEIPDEDLKLHKDWESTQGPINVANWIPEGKAKPLPEIFDNPNVYKQYPFLKDIKVTSGANPRSASFINDWDGNGLKVIKLGTMDAKEMKSVLSHEIQHAIQRFEGFGTGGASTEFINDLPAWNQKWTDLNREYSSEFLRAEQASDLGFQDLRNSMRAVLNVRAGRAKKGDQELYNFLSKDGFFERPELQGLLSKNDEMVEHVKPFYESYDKYQSLSGEVEARNVEARIAQGISGDRSVHPFTTEGYYPKDQTVRFGERVPYQEESFKGWHGTPHDFEPVDHNPFGEPVDHDPFAKIPTKEEAFNSLAANQRDEPERAMLRAQSGIGGGLMSHLLEHVGDLTHRMAEHDGRFGSEYVQPKVERALRALESGYGFEREHKENMVANNTPIEKENKLLKDYEDAHMKLQVYNKAQEYGRNAAIYLSRKDYPNAINALKAIKNMIDSGKYDEISQQYDPHYDRTLP